MPRTADHFAELMGNTDTAGSVRRGRSGLYVLRPRTSIHDGNAFTQRPMTVRVNRSRPNSLSVTTPKASTNTEVSSPSGLENADIEQISLDDDADMEITVNDGGSFMVLLEDANMDGVKHLSDKDRRIRAIWLCVLVLFTCLALYQIHNQVMMYINTPVATNIEADYPQKINFPTVAVCNNNQYRLTFLTGGVVQNRVPKNSSVHIKDINPNSTNVFDKALLNSWDMDAVKFLRYAAHWKSRMILRCIYPNGTRCRLADFKPVWTMTGLCWAINTDPQNPVYVHGAGPSHALKLLLNVERYERVESCSPKFRTTSLPGLKILIYNQTDIPVQSQDGVNAPPGFTIDMPFRMQHRQKLPGLNCIAEDKEDGVKKAQDAKTCMIMNMLAEVERQCACSMRRAYQGDVPGALPFCNVEEYFNCVVPVFKWGYDGGFMTFDCMANCDEIDYIAWQDLNELPDHIFPKLIDHNDDEDEDDAENELDGLYADLDQGDSNDKDEHYSCEQNQLLDDTTVSRIKREAHRAYEKQSRYQEDILLRTKRLTEKMRQTSTRIQETRWGWRNDNFTGIYERLSESTTCFSNMSTTHNDVFNAINNKGAHSEKQRAKKLINLLNRDNNLDILNIADSIHTISDTKRHFGSETIEELEKTLDFVDLFVHKVYSLYDEDSYTDKLSKRLERVDKMIMLVEQYEAGRLQRKVWAEKMQARNMRHFFDEDFFDSWYNIIVRELDVILGKTINDLEEDVDLLRNISSDVGAVLLFGTAANNHTKLWNDFIEDILDCTFGEVKNWTVSMAKEFKDVMHDFQTASTNLFRKELTGYLDNFEFGPKFVKENFAQVNVFLHKMNVEHWKQESTYSIWSLFCDVGGALGLFLGASLLTIIELLYQCCRFGVANNKWWSVGAKWISTKFDNAGSATRRQWHSVRQASMRRWSRKPRNTETTGSEPEENSDSDIEDVPKGKRSPVAIKIHSKGGRQYIMVPTDDHGSRFRVIPKPLRKVPGMIRQSFRGKDKPQHADFTKDTEHRIDMDLTEIRPPDDGLSFDESTSMSSETQISERLKSVADSIEGGSIIEVPNDDPAVSIEGGSAIEPPNDDPIKNVSVTVSDSPENSIKSVISVKTVPENSEKTSTASEKSRSPPVKQLSAPPITDIPSSNTSTRSSKSSSNKSSRTEISIPETVL